MSTLQILKSATESAIAQTNELFSIAELYGDFFGATSPSTKALYKKDRWEGFVQIYVGQKVNARDLIFIACQLTHKSRQSAYKEYIAKMLSDENHPRFDLFDADGPNGKAARTGSQLISLTSKIDNLQNTVQSLSESHNKLEAELGETKARTNILEAELGEVEQRADLAEARTNILEAELGETKANLIELGSNYSRLGKEHKELEQFVEMTLVKLEAELGETKAELNETKAEVGELTSKNNKLEQRVELTEAELGEVKAEVNELKSLLPGLHKMAEIGTRALGFIDKLPEMLHAYIVHPISQYFKPPIKGFAVNEAKKLTHTLQVQATNYLLGKDSDWS